MSIVIDAILYITAFFGPLSVSVSQIGYGLLAVIFIYGLVNNKYRDIVKNPYLYLILFLALVFLFTSLFGENPGCSLKEYSKKILLPCTFFIGYYLCKGERGIVVMRSVLYGGAVASIYAVIKFFRGIGPDDRMTAFASPVRFGNIMTFVVIIGISIIIFQLYRNKRQMLLCYAALLLSIVGLLGSTTRGAILGAIAGMFILFVYVFKKKGVLLSIGMVLILFCIVLLVPELKYKLYEMLFKWDDHRTSAGWRFVLWKESWTVFKNNVMHGVGFMNLHPYLAELSPPKGLSVAHAHNNYLQILAEHGVMGAIAICALFFKLFIDIIRGVFKQNHPAVINVALLAALFTEGLTEYCLFSSQNCMLYFLLTGLLIRAQEDKAKNKQKWYPL